MSAPETLSPDRDLLAPDAVVAAGTGGLCPAGSHVPGSSSERQLVGDLLRAFGALRRVEATLMRAEGAHFAFLKSERCKKLGFRQAADLSREALLVPDRTAYERVTLFRALAKSPKLERLFMQGKLTNCQVLAIAPMLDGPVADQWITRARQVTVRKLKEEVRKKQPGADHAERHSRRRITLDVPVEIAASLQECVEVGRKTIGHDCPPGEVFEAILAENGRAGLGNVEDLPKREPPRRRRALARTMVPARPLTDFEFAEAERLIERAQEFCDEVARTLEERDAFESLSTPTPFETFKALLKQIRGLHHPLRVLQTRLLRTMRRTRVDRRLGFDTFEDFVANRLALSARVVREMIRECEIFEKEPELETAFLAGRIGTKKAHFINSAAPGRDLERWIGRAEHVMTRAFEREVRLMILLRRYDARISRKYFGPLPRPDLLPGLVKEVCKKHDLAPEDLERELQRRGVDALPVDGIFYDPKGNRLSTEDAYDPAKNPPIMRRLEVLLMLLCTSSASSPVPGRNRHLFAISEPHTLFAFGCSDEVAADFHAMNRAFEEKYGPLMQNWIPIALAAKEAADVWTLEDPEHPPTQGKILSRDEYHCTFPGCSSRNTLEVNHVRPQSLGGSDDPWNLQTLCFAHHRDVFHAGHARITGHAPHQLRYEIGIDPETDRPLMVTIGNYIVERP